MCGQGGKGSQVGRITDRDGQGSLTSIVGGHSRGYSGQQPSFPNGRGRASGRLPGKQAQTLGQNLLAFSGATLRDQHWSLWP